MIEMKPLPRFFLLAGAALTALSMPAAAAAQSSGVAALLEQARYWEKNGRRDRAADAYRRVLAIDPDNAAAKKGLEGPPSPAPQARKPAAAAQPAAPAAPWRPTSAMLAGRDRAAGFEALEKGQLSQAADHFQAALKRQPGDSQSLGGLGLVRLRTERFAEAKELLGKASRGGSASRWSEALQAAEFYADLDLARASLDEGKLGQAQQLAERLAASDFAERAPALELLAAIYEKQGRYLQAAEMSKQAAALSVDDTRMAQRSQVNALRQQALAAWNSGDSYNAERLFQQGLLADSADPWIRYEFARFLSEKGRVAETDSLIRSLSQMDNPEAQFAAALLLDRLDRPGQAKEIMARFEPREMSPEMATFAADLQIDAAIERAELLATRGQAAQAMGALRQIGSSPGISPAKTAEVASVLYEMGDAAGASELAQQALAAQPSDLEAYEPIIRVLAQTGQEAFALSALQRVNEAAGNSAQRTAMVARLNGVIATVQADQLRKAGRYGESFDLLQSAWDRAPGNVEILASLARLYQSGGLSLQASQTFQMVLQKQPEDKGALIGLIDSASAIGDYSLADRALRTALSAHAGDYEVYLAGARLEKARGNDREARAYLERARELYVGQNGITSGGFPAANPFAHMRGAGGAGGLSSVNPFALGTNPQLASGTGYPGRAMGTSMPAAMNAQQAASPPAFGYAGAGNLPGAAPAPGGGGARPSTGDPVLDTIQQDLQQLANEAGPRLEVNTNYRSRSGEEGLSQLQEIGATATASTSFAKGRVYARANAAVLDAGRPTGSGLARFGTNATAEARAIVDEEEADLDAADTQHASGVALSFGYKSDLIESDVGTTPLGFRKTRFAGGIAVTPRFSPYASGRIWAERRPVTDSVVAYAGTEDPVTGNFWGSVMRTGGGVSFSWDRDGTGFYADGAYNRYAGFNVPDNEGVEINAGGYFRGYQDATSTLSFGINANYQAYDNNQNFFTYGHGGYFSPQSFLSIGFPIRYAYRKGLLEVDGSITPGFQSYEQSGSALYPTAPGRQAVLDALKFANSDVRARFDTISKTGFGMAADGSVYYHVSPRTRVGGEFEYNSFGDYNEFQTLLGVRQNFGAGE